MYIHTYRTFTPPCYEHRYEHLDGIHAPVRAAPSAESESWAPLRGVRNDLRKGVRNGVAGERPQTINIVVHIEKLWSEFIINLRVQRLGVYRGSINTCDKNGL